MDYLKKLLAALALSGLALTGCAGVPAPAPTVTVTAEPSPAPTVTVTVEPEVTQEPTPTQENSRFGKGAMTDAEFASFVRNARPSMAQVSEENIVGLADSTCRAFDRGASFSQVLDALTQNNTEALAKDFAFTAGAGVRIYCPEHATKIEG